MLSVIIRKKKEKQKKREGGRREKTLGSDGYVYEIDLWVCIYLQTHQVAYINYVQPLVCQKKSSHAKGKKSLC